MKKLLIITALVEGMTGLFFLLLPSFMVSVLFDVSLDTQVGLVLGRLAGAALLSLSIACWIAGNDTQSRAALAIVRALLFYNVISIILLTYVYIGLDFCGIGLWPAVILHLIFGLWCIVFLKQANKLTGIKETKERK
jgi:hypothetical protein